MDINSNSTSKDFSKSLEAFHIFSPEQEQKMRQKKHKRMGLKSMYKRYTTNKAFPAIQTGESNMHDEESSYVKRLSNWSMSYGTVQVGGAKAKENKKNSDNQDIGIGYEAQWRQYLKPHHEFRVQEIGTALTNKNINLQSSDLVVTASLSDISLMPTDTFKHKENAMVDRSSQPSEEVSAVYGNQDTEEDPAEVAKNVFYKVLRHQKSNFLNLREAAVPVGLNSDTDMGSGDNNSQYEQSQSPSTSSSSFRSQPYSPTPSGSYPGIGENENNKSKLKLIRPEDAGMVFDHERGLWEPLDELELRRRSLIGMGQFHSSSTTKLYYENADHTMPKNDTVSSTYPYQDDTPLAPPRLADQFKILKDVSADYSSSHGHSALNKIVPRHKRILHFSNKDTSPGNITDVNNLDISFSLSESAVVRALLDVIPDKQNWATVEDLDLSNRNLESLLALDQVAPNCTTLDVSSNDLNTLKGVPTGCIHLNCSKNKIGTYASLNGLPHLEILELSQNQLNLQNLSLFEPCRHLKVVDLSHNEIIALRYMPSKAQIQKLNLAHNKLSGTLDFLLLSQESKAWRYVEELDLTGNQITAVANLAQLSRLRILRLDGNPIKSIDGGGNALVRTLIILNNPRLHSVCGFPGLRILKCNGESLQLIQGSLPETLETLEIVGCSNNSTDQWNWSKILPRYLRTLKLRKMQLSMVPPIVQALPLFTLDLTHNCIINSTQLIKSLPPTLQELNLLGNPLWAANDNDRRLLVQAVKLYLFFLRGS